MGTLLYLIVIVDNSSAADYSVAMLPGFRTPRSCCRSIFVMTLVISLLLLGSGTAGAGRHMCRIFACSAPEGAQGSAAGCACCGAGEKRCACSGLAARCGQRAQDAAPVSVSNTENPTFHVGPTFIGVSLFTFDGGRAALPVFEHQIIRPVNVKLLC